MKVAVFGATGRVGNSFINLVHAHKSWNLNALVRNTSQAGMVSGKAGIVEGNAKSLKDVRTVLTGCDVVFSALNTDKNDTLSKAVPLIITAMKEREIKRIVTVGTAGILDSRLEKGKYRFQTSESKRKSTFAAEEHLKAYQILKESNLDWTIICPTYLPDGDALGGVRYEKNLLPENGKKITVGDTANFAVEVIEQKQFIRSRVGICY
ncbi:NAD(P)-dependent oxidoreductase [Thalassobacillus pellis]|uniref:NAD(P)-dependent oxidoreductase n=1 Tax=Thalassobacillus pellis TaxID=748008 RepID=UPI00195FB88F|nr:NAD(P)H-binding protein [Thalassobacillus pellis]MBM7551123.1 putative NADH-flavin reductase [Thalassobacillus pellis]